MRPECAWSMSTVGLTAQEISFPIENPFLRGSDCHTMAGSKSSWNSRTESNHLYFSMERAHTDHSTQWHLKGPPPPSLSYEKPKHSPNTQKLPLKKSRPSHLSLSCTAEPFAPSPVDNDQVVPSFQRLSVYEYSSPPQTPDRGLKPLPRTPLQTDFSNEQAMDSEVESFTSTDDSRALVSNQCRKSFTRNGVSRQSLRDCGLINYAYSSYYDGPSAPPSQRQPQQHHQACPPQEVREHYQHQQQQPRPEPPETLACPRQQDKAQRKLRRSQSGPAGTKPSLRLPIHKRYTHSMDKQELPPPIPPRAKTGDPRRWSAEVSSGAYSDEDKPPKVPPRDHLSSGSSRTPSPKSLPSYHNGVMPVTQSFAPDPNYVSQRGLLRQNSEPPCICPVMENGEKVSSTHYYLLSQDAQFV